jgi:hypothetical protein
MNEITNNSKKKAPSKGIRMAARIIGTLWVLICLFLFVGYYLEGIKRNAGVPSKPPDIYGIATVVCLFIAFGGLIIAWWREGIGGFISLSGFIIAGVLVIIDPKLNFSIFFFGLLLLPSILYLVYWWEVKRASAEKSKS